MELQHQCLPSVGEAVDQGDPPQRAAAVQALGHELGAGDVEFRLATRPRQDHTVKVLKEIELRIVDQHGIGEAEGYGNDPASQHWELVQASGEVPMQVLQGEGSAGARPEQPKSDDLHRLSGHLHVEKQRVQAAELAHR